MDLHVGLSFSPSSFSFTLFLTHRRRGACRGAASVSTVGAFLCRYAGLATSALTVSAFLCTVTDSAVEILADSRERTKVVPCPFVGLLTTPSVPERVSLENCVCLTNTLPERHSLWD
jgi:hypothetical protein